MRGLALALRSGAVVAGFAIVLALLVDGPSEPVPARAARAPEPPAARPAPPVARRPIATAYTVDQATRSLVYQVTSTTSGDVVFQSPSEDALRARAYAESVDRQRVEHPPQSDKPATVIA